jgi:glc operon protein GlcG
MYYQAALKNAAQHQAPVNREERVPTRILTSLLVGGAAMLVSSGLRAQQAAPPDPDAIPEKMPFSTPYGPPIGAQLAQSLIQAAAAEATKKGWPGNIAVVDSGGNLVAFLRMDGAMLASIAIAQHKARAAVEFRRPTKVFETGVQKLGLNNILSLDGVVASRGGIPLVQDGKIIGAIGCSGGTGSQDEAICSAGAALINK